MTSISENKDSKYIIDIPILVVDDNPAKMVALTSMLKNMDVTVVTASSGKEALSHLLNRDFAVVLLDVNMPIMDGFETAEIIRQRPCSEHLPIIFVTAERVEHLAKLHGYKLGAVDYIIGLELPEILCSKVSVFVDLFRLRMIERIEKEARAAELEIENIEKEKREATLVSAHEEILQFKVGLDNLSTGVIIADNDGKIVYVNPSAIGLFSALEFAIRNEIKGFNVSNIIGSNIDLFHKNPSHQRDLLKNLTSTLETNVPMGGHIINIKASPMINTQGMRIGSVAEWQDITEKEKRETELNLSRDENEILSLQVNHMQKLESIGRLTSGIAHDFNNILACMLGYNDMNSFISDDLMDESLKNELEKNTKQIAFAGQRATELIAKMMSYCRQHTPKEKIDVQPTTQVIAEVLAMLRPALTSRIKLEQSLEIDDIIQMDAIDLHQVLTNLAVNARDAMKERGGVITFSLKRVANVRNYCAACASIIDDDFIELSVSDNGTGIEPKIIRRLFDPFFTTKPQGEGTGLGLSAVSGLVHQSGGHILIESHQSQFKHGTAFKLLFPIPSELNS